MVMNFEIQFPNELQIPDTYFIRDERYTSFEEIYWPKVMVPLRGIKQCYLGPAHISVKWQHDSPDSHKITIKNMTNWTIRIKKNGSSKIKFNSDLEILSKCSTTINVEGYYVK